MASRNCCREDPGRESLASPFLRAAPPNMAAGIGRTLALATLRERIARIEGTQLYRLEEGTDHPAGEDRKGNPAAADPAVRPLGVAEADRALGGGFPASGLTEIHVDETRGGGTGAGFALSVAALFGAGFGRPVLWAGPSHAFSEAGLPYLPGVAALGFDPTGLLLVEARRLEDAIWAAEEASKSKALAVAILEVRGNPAKLSLEGTRRLHVRARETGIPFLLLRQGGKAEPTAAPFRLRIRAGPAAAVPDLAPGSGTRKLLGHPVFDVEIEKSRDGRPHRFLLEWNPHERRFAIVSPAGAEPHFGRLAAQAFDRPDQARAFGTVVALRRAS